MTASDRPSSARADEGGRGRRGPYCAGVTGGFPLASQKHLLSSCGRGGYWPLHIAQSSCRWWRFKPVAQQSPSAPSLHWEAFYKHPAWRLVSSSYQSVTR